MKESAIYRILNTANGKYYVGSAVNASARWAGHCRALRAGTHRNAMLQKAWKKYGADCFQFEILEAVEDKSILLDRENHWIRTLDAANKLVGYNICKVAGSQLGLRHSQETKRKMSAAHKGKQKTPEHQAKITAALKGKTISDDQKRLISESRKGTKAGPELRAKLKAAQQNRRMSEEARLRMVQANIGRKFPAEHKAKISTALQGKPKSEEHREKLRAAALRRYANNKEAA